MGFEIVAEVSVEGYPVLAVSQLVLEVVEDVQDVGADEPVHRIIGNIIM